MFEPKKILVPTDFSEFSDKALESAVDIAKKENATIESVSYTHLTLPTIYSV